MAALPHRSFDLGRQNSEMFSEPCEQLPLFLVGSQVSDHLALGYLHAEFFQVGLHVLHRTVRLLRQSTRGLINDWRSLQVRRTRASKIRNLTHRLEPNGKLKTPANAAGAKWI
jgi:hypothetical protein